jgi:hypothetical protein
MIRSECVDLSRVSPRCLSTEPLAYHKAGGVLLRRVQTADEVRRDE